jgi:hypothetical protein
MREYFELFTEGGIEKLKEVHFYRPESALVAHVTSSEEYGADYCARVYPPATIKEAQSEIETLTGIKRSETVRLSAHDEAQVAEFLKKNSISVVAKSGSSRQKPIQTSRLPISTRCWSRDWPKRKLGNGRCSSWMLRTWSWPRSSDFCGR